MNSVDPTRCPICHEPNVCAMEKAKETGSKPERCWCMDEVFSPSVMDQVPEAAATFRAFIQQRQTQIP